MRIGSLFSGGLDGLALGLGAALDGTVAFTAERDPWRRAQLERNYPEVPRHYADAAEPAEPVDLLCGGFPCQPHSVAGARRGTSDDRFGWPLFAAAIDRCRPSLVVVENVPGLRTSGLRTVLADLADRGFDAEWRLLSARDVGAPHRRTRLFLVAYSDRHAIRQERGRGEAWSPSSLSLSAMAKRDEWPLFPTPIKSVTKGHRRRNHPDGYPRSPPLQVMARFDECLSRRSGDGLATAVFKTGAAGPLSPLWTAWLMGFPIGFVGSPPSATPSSRGARTSSGSR